MIQQDHIVTFAAVYCIFYDKAGRRKYSFNSQYI